jgi:hypothetical protein
MSTAKTGTFRAWDQTPERHATTAAASGVSLEAFYATLREREEHGDLVVTKRNPDGSPRDFYATGLDAKQFRAAVKAEQRRKGRS